MQRRSLLVFAAVTVVATAVVTWSVADIRYDISLPRCVSGRRVSSCGGDDGWHGVSALVSALFMVPALFAPAASYLYLSSRLVRAAKARRRDELRAALRRRFAMTFLAAVALSLPVTLLVRAAL
ncbi:hypothetical protein [Actinoplanes utahensis]|uniref:Uncharacterized protein n=1 Tax=Actinoplanes utahensis TaxID=1869 RepID=A0A0A6XDB2_ACTUT|nr:hypothetical protein [Actinoplanes utahensis]KHD78087.1 hypothetical protein MB27_06215 [Actinoplanes utahensis]GIF30538.1 hypothetical protein Aut01nite_35240 [Actinoplanes utahensis]